MANSEFSSMKSSLISGFNDEKDMSNDCCRLFYKVSYKNKNLVICLRIYYSGLNTIFITRPNSIILLYDITSEESFELISSYYEKLIEKKKYEKTKFILVGNKKDLIHEVDENKENDESEKGDESKKSLLMVDNKVQNYCKGKKIVYLNDISGLSGEGVMELFEKTINILYSEITNMEEGAKEFDVSMSFDKNIENELNLSSTGQSYHSNEYKKEIDKINKKRKICLCCYKCTIF